MRRFASGFTLLELLVVVAILSAVAVASFGLIGEDRAQVRIEDTRNRLNVLRRAVLGVESPAYGGEMRLSGFVADNGRLPENLRQLLNGTGLVGRADVRAGAPPALSASIDAECFQTGTGDSLGEPARLLKGHRGSYLSSVAQNGEFRDGWGNIALVGDRDNFGWQMELTTNVDGIVEGMSITSLGADNARGQTTAGIEAEVDQTMSIGPEDWTIPLDGWKVTLRNAGSGSLPIGAIDAPPSGVAHFDKLGITLMVFENTTGIPLGRWRQYRSQDNSCGAVDSLAPGESCEFTFTNVTGCTNIPARVPLGRHILVLTANHGLPTRRVVTQVDFFPGTLPPRLVLEVR